MGFVEDKITKDNVTRMTDSQQIEPRLPMTQQIEPRLPMTQQIEPRLPTTMSQQ